jgi:RNA polymerase sigma-70 factor (ECF subfamily)
MSALDRNDEQRRSKDEPSSLAEGHDFGRLLIQHQQRIYGFIRSLVANRADAEDLLQETASVLWQKFSEFEPGSNFLAWALAVSRRQAMYFYQKSKRDVLWLSEECIDAISADTLCQSTKLAGLEDALAKCLAKLGSDDRQLITARYQNESSPKSLAEQFGRPVKTIYSALSRIRHSLTDCVERRLKLEAHG